MYKIRLNGVTDKYDYNELIKIFLKPEEFVTIMDDDAEFSNDEGVTIEINEELSDDKNSIKRDIFLKLSNLTQKFPPWGILTGVRPVKLTGEIYDRLKDYDEVMAILKETYLLSDEKAELLLETLKYQREKLPVADPKSVGVYIGIPFCPTRCLYCSFTSNQKGPEDIEKYLDALLKEIRYAGRAMKNSGMWTESIYIGGGTPTTLTAQQLDLLIETVKEHFDLSKCIEFTVEAGRPDTITKAKLDVLAKHGIERISINPQTMKDETLRLIGRSHSVDDIRKAFEIACEDNRFLINADLIAGLPEETPEDFQRTLEEVISLNPANITVHTLAVKRASRLIETDESYHYRQAKVVDEMLKISSQMLDSKDYRPYYLYRQKHMAGALENVGYCKDDTPCVYNIRIMDEHQSILALGAGGISKRYYPEENRLERVPNVSNYEIYIERLDEMIERKRINFFEEV